MADKKISQLVDGGVPQATDEFVVARAGDNFKIDGAAMAAAADLSGAVILLPTTYARNQMGPSSLLLDAIFTAANGFDTYEWVPLSGYSTGNVLTPGGVLGYGYPDWFDVNDYVLRTEEGDGVRQSRWSLIQRRTSDGKVTSYAEYTPNGWVGTEWNPDTGMAGRSATLNHIHGLVTLGSNATWSDYTQDGATLRSQLAAGILTLGEQADPAAPAANYAKVYARDNGSGATQYVVRFPTGAVYVLATEGDGAIYRVGGTDVALADGGTGASLADPNADRIMFWDDSAGAVTWLSPGTGLAITGTTIDVTGSPPSGSAGGVLSGTYPNPGFAVDMATQAELDAAVALLVPKSLYDANTILAATTDDTPAALTVGASTFVGRKASGNISAMSVAEALTLLGSPYTPGGTDVALADGGTGASTAAAARTNLGAAPTITTVDATLGADVTMVNANTFYDGPSASFAAGTWLINWKCQVSPIVATSQAYVWTAKLWDGTTVYDEFELDPTGGTAGNQNGWVFGGLAGFAIVTLGSTTTLKVSVACVRGSSASKIIRDPLTNSGASHTATRLSGVKVA